jgi:hypothetical protein
VTEKDCSKTLSTTAASVGVRTVLDFHEKRETVPQFETANFARVYGAHVPEELCHLGFQLEVPERRRVRRRVHGTELDAAHCCGPGIKYQLTAFDPQRLKPAKTNIMHLVQEPAFGR